MARRNGYVISMLFMRKFSTLIVVLLLPFFLGCAALQQQVQKAAGSKTATAKSTTLRTGPPPVAGVRHGSQDGPVCPVILPPEDEKPPRARTSTSTSSAVDDDGSGPAKNPEELMDQALELCESAQEFWQKGELDNAIDALDHAYALILEADPEDSTDLIQQKDDLRFMISRRMLEIYASRHTAAVGSHKAIPMVSNKFVDAEICSFTGPEREFFLAAYKRSGKYRPRIVKALKEAGLPEELSWLPLIESGFKVHAMSRARALGLWQFMASTGYKFGLVRDRYVDERMDPEKATEAAISYLKELHQIFGDWITCLAAYNCGEGRVLRVIRTQNVNYLDDFWDLYKRLPRETARYVPRFFAALKIIQHPEKYGMDLEQPEAEVKFEKVTINKPVNLKDVAQSMGLDAETLSDLNPELRYQITPADDYDLKVPPSTKDTLLASIAEIPTASTPVMQAAAPQKPRPSSFDYHTVKRGETLTGIARKYGVSTEAIKRVNHFKKRTKLFSGRKLIIPLGDIAETAQASSSSSSASASASPPPSPAPDYPSPALTVPSTHVVRRGESLFSLAQRYGTTVKAIKRANGLTSDQVTVGQDLKISGARPAPTYKGPKTYKVKRGDTAYSICKKFHISLEKFKKLNGLSKKAKVRKGQTVTVGE